MSIRPRPILVTGAGRGIGREIARVLTAAGHPVAVTALHEETAQETAAILRDEGGVVVAASMDVRSTESITRAVTAATASLGDLGGVVNNAGGYVQAPLLEHRDEDIDYLLAVNLAGPIKVIRAVLPSLRAFGSGRVVNIASDSARVGIPNAAAYAASKTGLLGLTRALARELARDSVTVNTVSPGTTEGPLFQSTWAGTGLEERVIASIPMRRLAQPDDVAAPVAFFCSEASGYITGQTVSVSGGAVVI